MMQKAEERASSKLLTFVLPTDMTKWNMTVKRIIKKIKKDPSDDFDTEYIDVDALLKMYSDWFMQFKKDQQKKLLKQYKRVTSGEEGTSQISSDQVNTIVSNMQSKQQFQLLSFGGQIT